MVLKPNITVGTGLRNFFPSFAARFSNVISFPPEALDARRGWRLQQVPLPPVLFAQSPDKFRVRSGPVEILLSPMQGLVEEKHGALGVMFCQVRVVLVEWPSGRAKTGKSWLSGPTDLRGWAWWQVLRPGALRGSAQDGRIWILGKTVVCYRKRYPTLPDDRTVGRGWGTQRCALVGGVLFVEGGDAVLLVLFHNDAALELHAGGQFAGFNAPFVRHNANPLDGLEVR